MTEKRLLAFVTDEKSQLFLHMDRAGLDILARAIDHLRTTLDKNEQLGHDHLMTEDWGAGS